MGSPAAQNHFLPRKHHRDAVFPGCVIDARDSVERQVFQDRWLEWHYLAGRRPHPLNHSAPIKKDRPHAIFYATREDAKLRLNPNHCSRHPFSFIWGRPVDTTATKKQVRYAYLSALRGIAALWVISVHVAHMPQPHMELPPWFDLYVANGVWGVQLFFVVSTFSLCLMQPSHADEQRPLLGFALRRFFRIAPLFYLLVAFTILSNFNPANFPLNVKTILSNVTFIFNLMPGYGYQTSIVLAGWTIGTEMMFYLIFPFVYARTKNVWSATAAMLISLAVAKVFSMTVSLFTTDPASYQLYSIFHHLPIFMFGFIAFWTLPLLKDRPNSKQIGVTLLASVPVQFYATAGGSVPFIEPYHWLGVMFASLVVGLALCPIRLLVNGATAWVGEISFSVYLVHSPIIVFLFPIYKQIQESGGGRIETFVSCFVLTLGCVLPTAAMTYHILEKPTNNWGKRLASRLAGRKERPRLVVREAA
ncbi:acyltransferase [Mesorhizobium sp. M0152]|uniref:acyltransferase family protein n=1 Tax=Mesorhizobium TaxID=68287 RepID=UPI0033362639